MPIGNAALLGIVALACAEPALAGSDPLAARARFIVDRLGTADAGADLDADGVVAVADLVLLLDAADPSRLASAVWLSTDESKVVVHAGAPPWPLRATLDAPGRDAIIRPSGKAVVLFDLNSGVLHRRSRATLALIQTIATGITDANDCAPTPGGAVVLTREDDTALWVHSGFTPSAVRWTDLSVFAPAGGTVSNRSMIVVEGLLYVQVQPVPPARAAVPVPSAPRALLAIVDLATGELVDADPSAPGVQGIVLAGSEPMSDMSAAPDGSWLLVSSPGTQHENISGIERIDLRTRTSVGLVVSENGANPYAQLSGFGITEGGFGVFGFHTDLASGTHLQWFDLDNGAAAPPRLTDSLGIESDEYAADPLGKLVYFSDRRDSTEGHPALPGLLVLNAADRVLLTPEPIPTPGTPRDIAFVP